MGSALVLDSWYGTCPMAISAFSGPNAAASFRCPTGIAAPLLEHGTYHSGIKHTYVAS